MHPARLARIARIAPVVFYAVAGALHLLGIHSPAAFGLAYLGLALAHAAEGLAQ